MKLLFCGHCGDVRALKIGRWTRCRCRRSRARYCDRIVAEVAGEHEFLLGFRNDSLRAALRCEIADREAGVARALGHEFTAFVIPVSSPNVIICEPRRPPK